MRLLFLFIIFISSLFSIEFDEFINKKTCDKIIDKKVFKICYDYTYKGAKAVTYTLDGKLVNKLNIKKRGRFYTEKNLKKIYRSHTKDYTYSGYDRGHLANDASFDYNKKTLRKTYTMANIVPQAPNINRKLWIKAERYERAMAVKLGKVDVVNKVVYSSNPKRIGKNKIAVPSGFYKILFNNEKNFEKCFYYTNELKSKAKGDKLKSHQIQCMKRF